MQHFTFMWNRSPLHASLDVDGTPVRLPPQAVMTLSPGQVVRPREPFPADTIVLVRFNGAFYCVEWHDAELSCNGLLFNGALGTPVVRIDSADREAFEQWYASIRDELRIRDATQGDMLRSLLKQFIIRCTRLLRRDLGSAWDAADLDVDLIRKYAALVEKHFRTHRRVSDYARMLYRSSKTLANAFRLAGGRSPQEVLHGRIELEARRLLRLTNRPVKRIARDLGFEDAAHFSRFFKRRTGESPHAFRCHERTSGKNDKRAGRSSIQAGCRTGHPDWQEAEQTVSQR